MSVLLVFLGGALGAPARYLLDRAVQRRTRGVFPSGTLAANVLGCLLLGALVGAVGGTQAGGWRGGLQLLAGAGFCGGLTTFSTFGFETVRLIEDGSLLAAGLNAGANLVLGVLAAAAGVAVGTTLS